MDIKASNDFIAFELGFSVAGGVATVKKQLEIKYLAYTPEEFYQYTGKTSGTIDKYWLREEGGKLFLDFMEDNTYYETGIELIEVGENQYNTKGYQDRLEKILRNE